LRRHFAIPIIAASAVVGCLVYAACLPAAGGAAASPPPLATAPSGPGGAVNLTLAPNLSFTDDSSSNFPIRGENVSDGRIASDRPTAIFFGTAHCWNTAREAERFVALYAKEKSTTRFLVVDIEHPSTDQRALISRFYAGFIPTLAILDRTGAVVYNRSGETAARRGDASKLEEILARAKESPAAPANR
jgi:hypothetical protein